MLKLVLRQLSGYGPVGPAESAPFVINKMTDLLYSFGVYRWRSRVGMNLDDKVSQHFVLLRSDPPDPRKAHRPVNPR